MIEVEKLVKSYGTAGRRASAAVDDISFTVPAGEVVTLLGASGCGKTTTLRCVAGLVSPDSGRIQLGERVVYDSARRLNVSPDKRDLGMVFQSYAIWPHMTVKENVAFPLRCRSVARAAIEKKVTTALELVGLAHLADRLAPNLSGGQQQRVALARAIVAEPDVLLLDEPLSNLDAKLRDDMRGELRGLQRRLGLTMCFVTHDQTEAMGLADTVVLMRDGRIVESGSPRQLYEAPRDPYTASFLGSSNLWLSASLGADGEKVRLRNDFGTFEVDRPQWWTGERRAAAFFFRRHNVRLVEPTAAGGPNIATGRVTEAVFLGETLHVSAAAGELTATVALDPWDASKVTVGDEIHFAPTHPLVFPAGAERDVEAAEQDVAAEPSGR
ncbi:ABC transporter ATP-binding protein [Phytohabitans kaempferiae]|uniref:ABC transporter ATP-binding protein n=1 Tax=Phytohabitans kaempferiae TaxID=1620943 RepID=A0ABV6LYI6_9ACTN